MKPTYQPIVPDRREDDFGMPPVSGLDNIEECRRERMDKARAYTETELTMHLMHRPLKNCLERIHAHNFELIELAREWIRYLSGEGVRPSMKICKYVNPKLDPTVNDSCVLLSTLARLIIEYGEGKCPEVRIIRYCYQSTLTLIEQLGNITQSVHLVRAEESISMIFYYLGYHGEPTMPPDEYTKAVLDLCERFVVSCARNAQELAVFTAEAAKRLDSKPNDETCERNADPRHTTDIKNTLREMSKDILSAIANDGDKTRKAVTDSEQTIVESVGTIHPTPPRHGRPKNMDPGLRGPKNTKMMKHQRAALLMYVTVELHKHPSEVTLTDAAHVWNRHEHKLAWDSAATRTDDRRGYRDYTSLYSAVIAAVRKKGFDLSKIIAV